MLTAQNICFRLIVCGFFTLLMLGVDAQIDSLRAEVRGMFGSSANIWIIHLQGHVAGLHQIDMLLGTDGTVSKGIYRMRSSGTCIQVEGLVQDNTLQLVEYSPTGLEIAHIIGHYDGTHFKGFWEDKGRTQKLSFEVAQKEMTAYQSCVDHVWNRVYEGTHMGQSCLINVHMEADEISYCMSSHPNKRYKKSMHACSRLFNLPLQDRLSSIIVIDTADLQYIQSITLDDNQEWTDIFTLKHNLTYTCTDFADYHHMYEMILPATQNKNFNKWLKDRCIHWTKSDNNKIKKKSKPTYGSLDRWVHNYYVWVEVDWYDEHIISGTIIHQNSFTDQIHKESFIFNLDKGKIMEISDLFIKDYNINILIEQYISDFKSHMAKINTHKMQWIKADKFIHRTVSWQGLKCTSDFSPIYGEEEVIIPFQSLAGHISSKNIMEFIHLK